MSNRDNWETPDYIISAVEKALNLRFVVDVCATMDNSKATLYWTEVYDSLSFSWAQRLAPMTVCWMNPPYSQLAVWTAKAAEEAKSGLIVVGLVPDMRSSKWYQENVEGVATLALLPDGRINFIPPGEVTATSNPWPSVLPVWTPWRTGQTQYMRFNRRPRYSVETMLT